LFSRETQLHIRDHLSPLLRRSLEDLNPSVTTVVNLVISRGIVERSSRICRTRSRLATLHTERTRISSCS
jgi:hypothetical protein